MGYYDFAPYVSVAERKRQAKIKMDKLQKQGMNIQPVEIEGRKITKTFWGNAWSDHIESLGDFENRLPRGRTYVRNGSVCHLAITKGKIEAMVAGSSTYKVNIEIKNLNDKQWKKIKKQCSGQIASLLDLLGGKLSDGVMDIVCDNHSGLFPLENEITLACTCPDWADMCKHVAAVLYGVGARLDHSPDQLFLLRGVNHEELVDVTTAIADLPKQSDSDRRIADDALGDVFGIDMLTPVVKSAPSTKKTVPKKQAAKQATKKAPTKTTQTISKRVIKKKPTPKTISGETIREKRLTLKLTQAELADYIGVTANKISTWERKNLNTAKIDTAQLKALNNFFARKRREH